MNLKDWLAPREEKFYDILDAQASIVAEGAEAFENALRSKMSTIDAKKLVKEIEHKGDNKTHELFTALNESFITPIDREDIAALAAALDDVLDYTYAACNHLHLYNVPNPPAALLELASVLHTQTKVMMKAINFLRDLAHRTELDAALVEIHRLENQADEISEAAVSELFQTDDVKFILKMKEIFTLTETATDRCEDVADVIRTIAVKHS